MRRGRRSMALASMVVAVVMLSACGQKGPLYLPQPQEKARKGGRPPAPVSVSRTRGG
ncbi:MAG TPA: hypothetical protein ENK62_01270 [Chromatiales bacterium]|nr:hypothetical protein [Chromatiales bacterium]